jgi:Ca2+-binding EF-hand superfamily protein
MAGKLVSQIVFEKHDADGSGFINAAELRSLCMDFGHYLSDEELSLAVKKLDVNGDGKITYSEFIQWWRQQDRFQLFKLDEQTSQVISAYINYYRYFDKDNSGSVDATEFRALHADLVKNGYGSYLTNADSDLAKLDTSGDGTVCFNEYIAWLVSIGAIPN